MAKVPELNIPASTSTVDVSILNTTGTILGLSLSNFVEPKVEGHDYIAAPCYAFLIQHPVSKRTLVFDLGIRKDLWNLPQKTQDLYNSMGVTITVPKGVREILDEQGVDTKNIEAVVWSHSHFDHTGNPSTFEPSTALIVGPGTSKAAFPGYPANPDNPYILESDYTGREVKELDFSKSNLKIGKFSAIDYFGDGSLYFLDTPGHCIGHICGFARVTSNPDSFILMGGDGVHYDGQLRPSHWHPLPDSISPHPFDPAAPQTCPGELFHKVLRDGKEEPIYLAADSPAHADVVQTRATIKGLQEFDAHDNIFVVPAHDQFLLNVIDFFPKPANKFLEKGWVKKARWMFLADFAKAVGREAKVEIVGDYRPIPKEEYKGFIGK
ncbi:beta-lactamase-like protein [Daldinia caldariorum]|uniref:beta-lactamase-like protein n=1 Tax=Daldinia caldariorum TaxID=326644 RepID=UPI0020074A30|nr:beta-lactamase-like protein [Daldinia caldariorum]KAI1465820.1 beta-lactamase-like protein [Daldinia caldariorum]